MNFSALPDRLDPTRTAFFLDVDGTLVDLEDSPDAVRVEPDVFALLVKLSRLSGGGVAIVTGRSLAAADMLMHPLKLPTASEHGLVRRDSAGALHAAPIPAADSLARIRERLELFICCHEGLLLEVKSGSLTMHHRQRPDLAEICARALAEAIGDIPGYGLGVGKMVHEARPVVADKGTAVAAFMAEAPFAGRVPLFAGDDVTDEDAIAQVNMLDGITIKIGGDATVARHRFTERRDFLRWLSDAVGCG